MLADLARTLADGLDVPSTELTEAAENNLFLRRVASLGVETAWDLLSRWLHEGTPASRRRQLRMAYFDLFLSPGAPVCICLMNQEDRDRRQVVASWDAFLRKAGLQRDQDFRNGVDHASVVFECTALLASRRDPLLQELVDGFVRAFVLTLTAGLKASAPNPFYLAMAELCMELSREVDRRFP